VAVVPAEPLAGTAILIADDDRDGNELLAEVLRFAGADVRAADSASTALEMLDGTWRPDAIVLDIAMPEVDGFGLLSAIRKTTELAGVPAIALSAHASEKHKAMTRAAGFAVHVSKPYEIGELVELLTGLIKGA
jgi:CheY-like chemotaxis protein